MANRYQDRPFSADGRGRGGEPYGSDRDESDPLAELARLIGQTDPAGNAGRPNPQAPPRTIPREQFRPPQPELDELPPSAGPPSWMQRANYRRDPQQQDAPGETQWDAQRDTHRDVPRGFPPAAPRDIPQEIEEQDYQASVHPLHRYAAPAPQADRYYQDEPSFDQGEPEGEASRYDDALYGQIETGEQDFQREPAYPDDPYAYQGEFEEEAEDHGRKRHGGLVTVVAILALAVVGTGGAFAYRTYVATPRNGEPPIIRADNSPTKIAPPDGSAKLPDRLALGDGTEKIVPREEAPVDVGAQSAGPRVVFPPLNPNTSPPTAASVAPTTMPPVNTGSAGSPSNGTLPSNEPRRVRTLAVKGDQPDAGGGPASANPPATSAPATRSAAASKTGNQKAALSSANASANGPLSLSPQQGSAAPADAGTRVASTNPAQAATGGNPASAAAVPSGGGYLVQVSAQRSEQDAQASFRTLQGKFPAVLSSQTAVIKRDDQGDKGIWYQAMVGPFGTRDDAVQFCTSYKSAGGQCLVKKN